MNRLEELESLPGVKLTKHSDGHWNLQGKENYNIYPGDEWFLIDDKGNTYTFPGKDSELRAVRYIVSIYLDF